MDGMADAERPKARRVEANAKRTEASERAYREAWERFADWCRHEVPAGEEPGRFYLDAADHISRLARLIAARGDAGHLNAHANELQEIDADPERGLSFEGVRRLGLVRILQGAIQGDSTTVVIASRFQDTAPLSRDGLAYPLAKEAERLFARLVAIRHAAERPRPPATPGP
jgi:hypothetical protein